MFPRETGVAVVVVVVGGTRYDLQNGRCGRLGVRAELKLPPLTTAACHLAPEEPVGPPHRITFPACWREANREYERVKCF